jgi:hypothetical protein
VASDVRSRVSITVVRSDRARCSGQAVTLPLLALVLCAALTLALLGAGSGGVPKSWHEPGAVGVAAAYGYPLRCLSITTSVADRRYARADFNRGDACGRFGWSTVAVFRRAYGAWLPVLETASYDCPVTGVPRAVQVDLSLCP